ncbi:hypothetical protein AJ88_48595 [Mesorhizobium amorphae CCBAU 01583]|nr:hypothetical protein AJ88_48595 [Mesorhizobium amorphae CCBAU 01583]
MPVITDGRFRRHDRAFGQQAHDGARRHRFARPGFADDGDGLAAIELEGDVLDGLDHAVLDLEVDGDVAGIDDRVFRTPGMVEPDRRCEGIDERDSHHIPPQ